jgi:hypothetical protein
MSNLFINSHASDSFVDGVVTTTLPFPVDVREDMGVNLCELSFGRIANVPEGVRWQINDDRFETEAAYCTDIEYFLNTLCMGRRGFEFKRQPSGAIRAKFTGGGRMTFSPSMQQLTGFPAQVINGDEVERGWDLFYFLPYVIVETDVVEKRPFGNTLRQGLRMVPMEYKNHYPDWDHFKYEFMQQNFVPMKRMGEFASIKICLTTINGRVVRFVKGGCLQAHLQFSPISSRLLV